MGKRRISLQQWSGKKKCPNCQFSLVQHSQVSIETLAANRNKSPLCPGALAASVRESERWNSVTSFLRGGSNSFLFFFPRWGRERREGEGGREQHFKRRVRLASLPGRLTHRDRSRLAAHACTFTHSQLCPPPFFFRAGV